MVGARGRFGVDGTSPVKAIAVHAYPSHETSRHKMNSTGVKTVEMATSEQGATALNNNLEN